MNSGKTIWLIGGALALLVVIFLVGRGGAPAQTASLNNTVGAKTEPAVVTTADGLQIQDIEVGTGAEAKAGDTVTVDYEGTLPNGSKFDSSFDRGTPFSFTIGAGKVIKGWDEGVAGMKIGGTRKLVIPPALAYGNTANELADQTLTFRVVLHSIQGK